jgi:hypothetical protein
LQTTSRSFVENGGNLIVPSEKDTAANLEQFLSNFGAIQFKPFEQIEKLITKINFSHPLFKAVFENKLLISNIRKQTVPSQ